MYWENSCASGTSAVAMYLAKKEGKALSLLFHEPGGMLEVKSDPAGEDTWLYGIIRLVEEYSTCRK
jgi:diaminopimelate epimerase